MLSPLKIDSQEETPEVVFNPEENIFRLKGRSYPENARSFYAPISNWLKEYSKQPNDKTHLEINLEYFNSGSVKELFGLLYLLEELQENGNEAVVTWYYLKGDELIYQKGAEFKDFLEIPVNLIEH